MLQVQNIEKYYGSQNQVTKALDRVSFTVEDGAFIAIMGASGSGKTTLLNCISTIDTISAGDILLDGQSIAQLSPRQLAQFRRERLGFVFQDCNLLDTLTLEENIGLALSLNHADPHSVQQRVRAIAEELEIGEILDKFPYQVSGGQKQRAACARAMVAGQSLLLADEPTGALMYAFNGLVFSREIAELSAKLSSLPLVIVLASVAVVLILGWLVAYITRFMLTRRSRELGTYLLIGLEHRQVARLFFLENLAVGAVALVLGVVLGNLMFQILRAIMLALFGVEYRLSFAFSLEAVGMTLLYVLLVYLLALGRSRRRIRRMQIHDFMELDRQNENVVIRTSRRRRRVFVLSRRLGAVGTVLLLAGGLLFGLVGAGCIIAFLYGFFLSFASGVPAFFEKHPGRKYRGQTLVIFRTLTAKLATMGVVMATISLLFTATLLSEGSGMVFSALFQNRMEKVSAFDLYIGTKDQAHLAAYQAYLDRAVPVTSARQYSIYQGENTQVTTYCLEKADYHQYYDEDTLLGLSDYNALRAMKGWPAVTLAPGTCLFHCRDYLAQALTDYHQPIPVAGQRLTPAEVQTGELNQDLWDANGHGFVIVVPDQLAAARPVSHSVLAAMTEQPVTAEQFAALCTIRDGYEEAGKDYDTLYSRADQREEFAALSAMTVFPLYYLALVLAMTAATILTVQQLSETDRYRRQFELLRKLGMDGTEMGRALRRQFALYYAMPVLPAGIIGVAFVRNLGGAVEPGTLTGLYSPGMITAAALGLFFLLYGIYILMAYTSLKRTVLPEP